MDTKKRSAKRVKTHVEVTAKWNVMGLQFTTVTSVDDPSQGLAQVTSNHFIQGPRGAIDKALRQLGYAPTNQAH